VWEGTHFLAKVLQETEPRLIMLLKTSSNLRQTEESGDGFFYIRCVDGYKNPHHLISHMQQDANTQG
jgi:hypothetical protein